MTVETTLLILGASGDLTSRLLLPALGQLLTRENWRRVHLRGAGMEDWSDDHWRDVVRASFAASGSDAANDVVTSTSYQQADITRSDDLQKLVTGTPGRLALYFAVPPAVAARACQALRDVPLPEGTILALEKPFGVDEASAHALNDVLTDLVPESQVFRVDHYLGKEGVQNLLALRFGNALFEPLWNARHIEQVQITVAETVGVEGRGDYYDDSGAMRDMLQNHLLQLLCLVAMEPPSQFEPSAVRNEKLKVLRSLRPIGRGEVVGETAAGQYTAGAIDGVAVPGYAQELGRDSSTETFAAIRAHVDNWRWSGVPFYLRTGKRLPQRRTEIYIQFRQVPHSIFGQSAIAPNSLLIALQPEEHISLRVMSKTPGLDRAGLQLSKVTLDLDMQDEFAAHRRRPAYERLYLDALEGNGTLFVRRDETEADEKSERANHGCISSC